MRWWQRRPFTRRAFEKQYAERSGVSVAWLYAHGRRGATCRCEEDGCHGWQMTHGNYPGHAS